MSYSQSINFKVESGLQLLERLKKNNSIGNFYPSIFKNDFLPSDLIEISGNAGTGKSLLLINMIVDAVLPTGFSGIEAGVIVFNVDGNFSTDLLLHTLKTKIDQKIKEISNFKEQSETILDDCLKKIYILDIYDPSQFYLSILNLENILLENSKISIVAFDTVTAFYWTEQNNRLIKMDTYIQNILKLILKVIKPFNTMVVFTVPEYYTMKRDVKDSNKFQSELSSYRIMLNDVNDHVLFMASLYLNEKLINTKHFELLDYGINWLS